MPSVLGQFGDTVTLRSTTARSRAGVLFGAFAVVWIFAGLLLFEWISTLFVPRELRPRWLSYLLVAQALLPGVIAVAAGQLGRHRPFRWLIAWPQPSAAVDDTGMDLCLPERGCERYEWEEVGRLVPSPFTRRERWVRTVSYPRFELWSPDGRVLATLPHSLALPRYGPTTGGLLGRRMTLAEVVVARRPARFGLLRPPGPMSTFLSFALLKDAPPAREIEAAARRLRVVVGLLIGGLVAFGAVGVVVVFLR